MLAALWLCLSVSISVCLIACGGGGGSSSSNSAPAVAPVAAGTLRVHYHRADQAYAGWGVYAWQGPQVLYLSWPSGDKYRFDQTDPYGEFVDIPLDPTQTQFRFLINQGTDPASAIKDGDCDRVENLAADVTTVGQEIWLTQGDCGVYDSAGAAAGLSLDSARALWIDANTLVWPGTRDAGGSYVLYAAPAGGMALGAGTVTGAGASFPLTPVTLTGAQLAAYPVLQNASAYALGTDAATVRDLLKGQLVIARISDSGQLTQATQLQIQGVLDDVYSAAALPQTLGVSLDGSARPTFKVWAPTARSVTLDVGGTSYAMTADSASGVWSFVGDPAWTHSAYYSYTVQVWSRTEGGALRSYTVTDPYALTLDADVSGGPPQQAMVTDLSSPAFKPAGWDAQPIPALGAPTDMVVYELHIRDFSANDPTVPAALQGKYEAFAQAGSAGTTHLQAMAQAGLTHVHLLPAFDFSSVNEGGCVMPSITSLGPVSQTPQAEVAAVADQDCYNWGYDPSHYAAPEGSYATDASDGTVRVRQFRDMVRALHGMGLGVVMDVVYNHTSGNFLDRIVPGYYYRLDGNGAIETSTCCQNTAPEFAMMAKLMRDSLVSWVTQYKIDGFRFDIMGHIPKAVMLAAQAQVNAAAGRSIYFYGEAWNFGEVANDRLFVQARQAHLGGTGIGSFSDRLRDAVRGGGPLDSGAQLVANQGFANGHCVDPNAQAAACDESALNLQQNWIRLSMAGNLADYPLNGVLGSQIDYNGQPAGYTQSPQEIINYVGSHDGQTLWDIGQYKQPVGTSSADRARSQVVALGTVLMGQGIPFMMAGDELLRSKAMDSNSYNSDDWFNRIDWSASTNYFDAFGLPPAAVNQSNWALMTPVLQNPLANPSAADIVATREAVKDLLRIRRDTTMLRLRGKADVLNCVQFPDAASQAPGLIVMQIGQGDGSCGDGKYKDLVVMLNAGPGANSFRIAALQGQAVSLHPVQAAGSDPVVKSSSFDVATGTFHVPARTVAVFVRN